MTTPTTPSADDAREQTPTPRTDAIAERGYSTNAFICTMTDHARTLERENAALVRERDEARYHLGDHTRQLVAEVDNRVVLEGVIARLKEALNKAQCMLGAELLHADQHKWMLGETTGAIAAALSLVPDTYRDELAETRAKVEELAAWKESAMHVESKWDCQRVGELLGLRLGSDIREQIEPAIRTMKARLAVAEEVAKHAERVTNELAELIKDEQDDRSVGIVGWTALHGSVTASVAALARWRKEGGT